MEDTEPEHVNGLNLLVGVIGSLLGQISVVLMQSLL